MCIRDSPNPIPIGYSKMIQWCLDNSIAVCVVPDWSRSSEYWKIEIKINNKVHVDPTVYTVANVHEKMYEYYNTIMTNTIKQLDSHTIAINHFGKTKIVTLRNCTLGLKSWYNIKGKIYA